jgi:hypothetical protein
MKPIINNTEFGSITIDKKLYNYDVVISLNGQIKKRKKELSKTIFGSSHTISLDEAKYVYEEGVKLFIVGKGQYSAVKISKEAMDYFLKRNCQVQLYSTKEAIGVWNNSKIRNKIGLFHLTC